MSEVHAMHFLERLQKFDEKSFQMFFQAIGTLTFDDSVSQNDGDKFEFNLVRSIAWMKVESVVESLESNLDAWEKTKGKQFATAVRYDTMKLWHFAELIHAIAPLETDTYGKLVELG